MRALLDVNVLIALLDEAHIHHRAATRWLTANIELGWASCPVTQNGCIRIMSHPSYPNCRGVAQVVARLKAATATPHHVFCPDDIQPVANSALAWNLLLTSKHLTDVYLLALAVKNQARLVSFDQQIPQQVVPASTRAHLVVIE